ncbi:MAG: nprA [Bacteroidetes bacterium]|jgi:serine phosphatase RsbU (regulator of sigma subunit)|nr:nprA [Bacteroidota bacterium]
MKKIIFIFLIILSGVRLFAQTPKLDSLKLLLKQNHPDTVRYDILNTICEVYFQTDPHTSEPYLKELLAISRKINDDYRTALAMNISSQLYYMNNKLDTSLLLLDSAMKHAMNSRKENAKASILDSYGAVYEIKGDYNQALKYHLEAVAFYEKMNSKRNMANSYKYIGRILSIQEKFSQALPYFRRSLSTDREIKNRFAEGQSLNNVGIVHFKMKNVDSALTYFLNSVQVKEETKNKRGLISSYANVIDVYLEKKDFETALKYSEILTRIGNELKSNNAMGSAYQKTGDILSRMQQYKAAKDNYHNALHYSTLSEKKQDIMTINKKLSETFKKLGNSDSALFYFEKYDALNTVLFNENNTKSMSDMEAKYQNEKKEQENKLLLTENKLSSAEISKQKTFTNFLIIVAVLILILSIVSFRAYQNKKSVNEKLTQKNSEIEQQKEIIEEKQKGITDSINYALRIQEAVLPSKELKTKLFPDSFVLFMPKDIVSGDFYWFSEKNGKKIITAVDCTGHGVPGAFMSMIGISFLNEIVNEKEITEPALILGSMRDHVKTSLKQRGLQGEAKDGMDMALLSFSNDHKTVEYAGANNSAWIIRNGNTMIEEIDPDKRPIGYFKGLGLPFTNHKLELQKGDTVYIFTDGYADQFGGPRGKKFKYKQLKDLLISIQSKPMHEQEGILIDTLNSWRGNLEQVDDVCIIGVRV